MRVITILFMASIVAGVACAQDPTTVVRVTPGATTIADTPNLPIEKIGRDDLIGITVYDSPELTRTVRVDTDGTIRLPMLKAPIEAAGLYPVELEQKISSALISGQVLVDPIVTISVVEYRSRPISVMGAVKGPIKFQATGVVTLLDALAQAQGLTDNAGSEVVVTRMVTDHDGNTTKTVQRIPLKGLINDADPALNLQLVGGEEIRVPEAGKIFVVGDVHKPGAYQITDGVSSSVLKALALSEGLDSFSGKTAYIYRPKDGSDERQQIPIQLGKIMNRKTADVALLPNDILYIPTQRGTKATFTALDKALSAGASLGAAGIYVTR